MCERRQFGGESGEKGVGEWILSKQILVEKSVVVSYSFHICRWSVWSSMIENRLAATHVLVIRHYFGALYFNVSFYWICVRVDHYFNVSFYWICVRVDHYFNVSFYWMCVRIDHYFNVSFYWICMRVDHTGKKLFFNREPVCSQTRFSKQKFRKHLILMCHFTMWK